MLLSQDLFSMQGFRAGCHFTTLFVRAGGEDFRQIFSLSLSLKSETQVGNLKSVILACHPKLLSAGVVDVKARFENSPQPSDLRSCVLEFWNRGDHVEVFRVDLQPEQPDPMVQMADSVIQHPLSDWNSRPPLLKQPPRTVQRWRKTSALLCRAGARQRGRLHR